MADKFVSVLDEMRQSWDARAGSDPLHASHAGSGQAPWTKATFLASGESLVATLAEGFARRRASKTHTDLRVLDYGCGAGRLVPGLHSRFRQVHGVDISPRMLVAADELVGTLPGVIWHLGDGMTLQCVRRYQFQLAVCYDVLAHLPDLALANYILRQISGRLEPSGLLFVQVPSTTTSPSQLFEHSNLEVLDVEDREGSAWTWARRCPKENSAETSKS